jgi:uncharacterized membrane protein YkvA (DUF1232 family)
MLGLLKLRYVFLLLPRTYQYLKDKSVPLYYKWLPFIGLAFFFTPIARVLNAYPPLGLIDEFTFTIIGMVVFTWLSRQHLQRLEAKMQTETVKDNVSFKEIEGEYEVVKVKTARIGKKDVKANVKLVA